MGCMNSTAADLTTSAESSPGRTHGSSEELVRRLQAEEDRAARLEAASAELARRLQAESDERARLESASLALARRLQEAEGSADPEAVVREEQAAPSPLPEDAELRGLIASLSTSALHTECCICFDSLYERPSATLTLRGANACPHFFHLECAQELCGHSSMHCPQCRLPFDNIKEVPRASEDPDGWFFCVDVEGDGRLSRTQVLNVLLTQFPLDWRKTEEALPTLWERWDRDGSGFISRQEFMDPDGGLLAFVRAHLLHLPTEPPAGATPAQWFRYFDDDHSGSLTRPQCMRALVKSSPALTVQTVEEMFAPLGLLPPEATAVSLAPQHTAKVPLEAVPHLGPCVSPRRRNWRLGSLALPGRGPSTEGAA